MSTKVPGEAKSAKPRRALLQRILEEADRLDAETTELMAIAASIERKEESLNDRASANRAAVSDMEGTD